MHSLEGLSRETRGDVDRTSAVLDRSEVASRDFESVVVVSPPSLDADTLRSVQSVYPKDHLSGARESRACGP